MNSTMIASTYIRKSQLRAVTNFYRSSMVQKIPSSNKLIRLNFVSLLKPERAKTLATSYPTESLALEQHAAKQDFSWDKSSRSRIQSENVISIT